MAKFDEKVFSTKLRPRPLLEPNEYLQYFHSACRLGLPGREMYHNYRTLLHTAMDRNLPQKLQRTVPAEDNFNFHTCLVFLNTYTACRKDSKVMHKWMYNIFKHLDESHSSVVREYRVQQNLESFADLGKTLFFRLCMQPYHRPLLQTLELLLHHQHSSSSSLDQQGQKKIEPQELQQAHDRCRELLRDFMNHSPFPGQVPTPPACLPGTLRVFYELDGHTSLVLRYSASILNATEGGNADSNNTSDNTANSLSNNEPFDNGSVAHELVTHMVERGTGSLQSLELQGYTFSTEFCRILWEGIPRIPTESALRHVALGPIHWRRGVDVDHNTNTEWTVSVQFQTAMDRDAAQAAIVHLGTLRLASFECLQTQFSVADMPAFQALLTHTLVHCHPDKLQFHECGCVGVPSFLMQVAAACQAVSLVHSQTVTLNELDLMRNTFANVSEPFYQGLVGILDACPQLRVFRPDGRVFASTANLMAPVTDVQPVLDAMARHVNLRHLVLSQEGAREFLLGVFRALLQTLGQMPQLEILDMQGLQIHSSVSDDELVEHFSKLESLQELKLFGGKFTSQWIARAFGSQSHLVKVSPLHPATTPPPPTTRVPLFALHRHLRPGGADGNDDDLEDLRLRHLALRMRHRNLVLPRGAVVLEQEGAGGGGGGAAADGAANAAADGAEGAGAVPAAAQGNPDNNGVVADGAAGQEPPVAAGAAVAVRPPPPPRIRLPNFAFPRMFPFGDAAVENNQNNQENNNNNNDNNAAAAAAPEQQQPPPEQQPPPPVRMEHHRRNLLRMEEELEVAMDRLHRLEMMEEEEHVDAALFGQPRPGAEAEAPPQGNNNQAAIANHAPEGAVAAADAAAADINNAINHRMNVIVAADREMERRMRHRERHRRMHHMLMIEREMARAMEEEEEMMLVHQEQHQQPGVANARVEQRPQGPQPPPEAAGGADQNNNNNEQEDDDDDTSILDEDDFADRAEQRLDRAMFGERRLDDDDNQQGAAQEQPQQQQQQQGANQPNPPAANAAAAAVQPATPPQEPPVHPVLAILERNQLIRAARRVAQSDVPLERCGAVLARLGSTTPNCRDAPVASPLYWLIRHKLEQMGGNLVAPAAVAGRADKDQKRPATF